MKKLDPIVTSTPDEQKTGGYELIRRGRRGIHSNYYGIVKEKRGSFGETSPILNNDEPEHNSGDEEFTNDEEEFSNEENLKEHSTGFHKDNDRTPETNVEHSSFISKGCIITGLIVSAIICASYLNIGSITNPNDNKFSDHVHNLKSKYMNVNPVIFAELESAVKFINKSGSPLSFVFAHHSDEQSTKMTLALIKDFAQLASQYLGNGTTLTISPDNLDIEDYGELLTLWRSDIEQGHTVVVTNLEQMPAHLAPVFHTMCDEVTPYVRGTLYLHTVNLGSNSESKQQRNTKSGMGYFTTVEKRLRQSWPNMADEIFDPLLTRIAGSVHILDYKM